MIPLNPKGGRFLHEDKLSSEEPCLAIGTLGEVRSAESAGESQVVADQRARAGLAADGRPYSAQDPELLTWVHATEVHGFLAGFRHYSGRALPDWAADRYLDEMRRIAEALGASNVPASRAGLAAYFDRVQPQLDYTSRSRTVLDVLAGIRLPAPLPGLSRSVFLGAGTVLLPEWAQQRLELSPQRRRQARLQRLPLASGRSACCQPPMPPSRT